MKLSIGYVNNGYRLGGAETVVWQLVDGVERAGHETRLYVADGKTYPDDPRLVPLYPRALSRLDHSRFHDLNRLVFPRNEWTDRAFRKLATCSHDLIHIHSFHGTYASIDSLVYLAQHKPVVWTFHRFWGITGGCDHPGGCLRYMDACGECPRVNEWPIEGVDNTAEQLALKKKVLAPLHLQIVAPSQHLAETVRESVVGRNWTVTWIPNGVDVDAFSSKRKSVPSFRAELGLSPDATTVVLVNRDFRDSTKGFETIAASLPHLNAANLQLIFVGGNSAWAISRCPPEISCVDMGYVSSRELMAQIFEASDICLYSSPGENFPCVVLEAMAAGCCLVSTPTDGVLEQIENGVSGYIARSFDPSDLAAALSSAIAEPERRVSYAAAGRDAAGKKFSEKAMIKSHLDLYQETIRAWLSTRSDTAKDQPVSVEAKH